MQFKALNDRNGHSAGDRALVEVANAPRASVRGTAVVALPVGITASVGTAYTAVYRAKRGGGNGFIHHGPGALPQPLGGAEGEP